MLKDINVKNKRVFLRVDLNVPIKDKKIANDHKFKAILPTIDYLLEQKAKIILATHIGRPKSQTMCLGSDCFFDEQHSTKLLLPWFQDKNYNILHEADLLKAIEKSKQSNDTIVLLENLRLFKGEQESSEHFAELLAQCSDIYINDAFGVIHRNDTSVTLLPQQFATEHKAFGLLIEKELNELHKLKEKPFVAVLGGSKIETKIKVINQLLEQPIQNIIIGGLLSHVFLLAQGISVGKTKIKNIETLIPLAQELLIKAKNKKIKILLPTDVQTVTKLSEAPKIYPLVEIPQNNMIVDIGPETIKQFSQAINSAQNIFFNGTMGIYEDPQYAIGTKAILEAIVQSKAYSILGGGDAVAAAYQFGLEQKFDFLSTGGGATLAFLASDNPEQELSTMSA